MNYNFSSFRITAKPTHTLQLFRLILSKKWNSPKFHLPLSILRKSLTMYGLFEIDRTAVLNWITRLSFNCNMDSSNQKPLCASPIGYVWIPDLIKNIKAKQTMLEFIFELHFNIKPQFGDIKQRSTCLMVARNRSLQTFYLPCITIQSMSKSTRKK